MMKRKIWAALVFSAGVILSVQADFRLESAKGKTYCIAVDQKSVQENAAAKHLQENLGKMFPGAGFRIVSPSDVPETRESVIYVGNTSRLRDQGIDLSKFGREEMLILQKGKDLYLAGGYPRGTLYSVFEFLEKTGVVYASSDTLQIPVKKELTLPEMRIQREPAFRYRYTYTGSNISVGQFKLFNKYNGYRVSDKANGWYAAYGSFGDCHTLARYSRMFPVDDPTLFAMGPNGKRITPAKKGLSAPLCLSSAKTQELIWQLTKDAYEKSRKRCQEQKRPMPETYEISLDDNLSKCFCPACRAVTREEGCYTGNILRLVNMIARRMRDLDPAAKVSMLVYQNTLMFPKKTLPEKNVLPRICVHDNEWIIHVLAESVNPLTHKNNQAFLKVFKKWEEHSTSLGIWEYWSYFTKPSFPFVALDVYFENLKYYRGHKVENVLIEMGNHTNSFFALKLYLALKLMDDPQRDREKLIAGFMNVYYGKAAEVMTKYLNYLDSEVRKESEKSPMGPRHPSKDHYLNADFFLKSYAMLEKAEKLAAQDARSLRHVRWEYIALDYGLVLHWKKCAGKMPFDKKFLLERIRKYQTDQIDCLVIPKAKGAAIAKMNSYLLGESIELPLPPEVKGEYVFDFKAYQLPANTQYTKLVRDPDSAVGAAIQLTSPDGYYFYSGQKIKFHKLPFVAGVYNNHYPARSLNWRLNAQDIPQDEKYHLYKLGKCFLVNLSKIYLHWAWQFQFWPRNAYTATVDYPYDIYISLKFTGPAYVKGSKQKDAVYVDRIIAAR